MALFDNKAATYDEFCETPIGQFVDGVECDMIASAAKPSPGEMAVDLGCGTGSYSIWLAEQGVTVTGVDQSSNMLEVAKEKAVAQKQDIRFIEGDIQQLPFSAGEFDLALINVVLEFIEHPEKVISEALRVLKPGGRLVTGMIGKQSEWATMYKKKGKEDPRSVFAHARFFSLQDIQQLNPLKPSFIRFGLYVGPAEFGNMEQAAALEQQRAQNQQETGAGFIVARWDK